MRELMRELMRESMRVGIVGYGEDFDGEVFEALDQSRPRLRERGRTTCRERASLRARRLRRDCARRFCVRTRHDRSSDREVLAREVATRTKDHQGPVARITARALLVDARLCSVLTGSSLNGHQRALSSSSARRVGRRIDPERAFSPQRRMINSSGSDRCSLDRTNVVCMNPNPERLNPDRPNTDQPADRPARAASVGLGLRGSRHAGRYSALVRVGHENLFGQCSPKRTPFARG